MIGFDLTARLVRRGDDRLTRPTRLGGSQEAAEPAVAEGADPPKGGVRRSADPNIQRRRRFREHLRSPHGEIVTREVDGVFPQRNAEQLQRLVEYGGTLPLGYDEEVAFGR